MHSSCSHVGDAGIALLEVLLSIVVIGVGLGTAMQALSTGARLQSGIEDRTEARHCAAMQLARLRASSVAPGEYSGAFSRPHEKYRWSAIARPLTGGAGLVAIDFRVFRGDGDQMIYNVRTLFPAGQGI